MRLEPNSHKRLTPPSNSKSPWNESISNHEYLSLFIRSSNTLISLMDLLKGENSLGRHNNNESWVQLSQGIDTTFNPKPPSSKSIHNHKYHFLYNHSS